MTLFLILRHAMCDPVGRAIAGRAAGVHLNDAGVDEARALAARLAGTPVDAVYSSPMERARETASAVAGPRQIDVSVAEDFNEIDYGDWTGKTLTSLEGDELWHRWNSARGSTRVPGGESMLEVQQRAVSGLECLGARHPQQTVAVVTHGDVIKSVLAWCTCTPLDQLSRFTIDTASLTILRVT